MSSARQYPPKPIASNKEMVKDSVYGNGEYEASSSSVFQEQEPWKAFDGKAEGAGDIWHTETMINEAKDGFKEEPEWIQLQLPNPILLKKYTIQARDSHNNQEYHKKDFPNKFQLMGSNNDSAWTAIDTKDDVAKDVSTEFEKKEFSVSTTTPYKYYRLEVENVGAGGGGRGKGEGDKLNDSYVAIAGLFLFGEEVEDAKWVESDWPDEEECEEDPEDEDKEIMTRTVECKRGDLVVDDGECTEEKPDTTKECETKLKLPWLWIGIGAGVFFFMMMMMIVASK